MRQLFTQAIRKGSNTNNLSSILATRNINTEAQTILNNLKTQLLAGAEGHDLSGESVKNSYYTKDVRDSLEDQTNNAFKSIEKFKQTSNGSPKQIIEILNNLLKDPDIKSQLTNTLDPFDKKSSDAIKTNQENAKPRIRPLNKYESLSAFNGITRNIETLSKIVESQDLHTAKISTQQGKRIEF